MAKEKLVAVRYVGAKPFATDRFAHTGKVWNGKGDVQKVTEYQAKILCKYPDQWQLDKGKNPSEKELAQALDELPPPESPKKPESMDMGELAIYAMRYNIVLDPDMPKEEALRQIETAGLMAEADNNEARNNASIANGNVPERD